MNNWVDDDCQEENDREKALTEEYDETLPQQKNRKTKAPERMPCTVEENST